MAGGQNSTDVPTDVRTFTSPVGGPVPKQSPHLQVSPQQVQPTEEMTTSCHLHSIWYRMQRNQTIPTKPPLRNEEGGTSQQWPRGSHWISDKARGHCTLTPGGGAPWFSRRSIPDSAPGNVAFVLDPTGPPLKGDWEGLGCGAWDTFWMELAASELGLPDGPKSPVAWTCAPPKTLLSRLEAPWQCNNACKTLTHSPLT